MDNEEFRNRHGEGWTEDPEVNAEAKFIASQMEANDPMSWSDLLELGWMTVHGTKGR